MKTIKLLLVITAVMTLSACAASKANQAIAQGHTFSEEVNETGIERVIKGDHLTDDERFVVHNAFLAYNLFNMYWQQYTSKPESLTAEEKQKLYDEYLELKERYIELESVVIKHWDSYSQAEKHQLEQLRSDAYALNRAVEKAIRQHKIKEVIDYIIKLTTTVIEMGVKTLTR